MRKLYVSLMGAMLATVVFAGNALAAADATLVDVQGDLLTYFTDNLPVVIAGFIGVAGVLWLLGLLVRSIGVGRNRKVG